MVTLDEAKAIVKSITTKSIVPPTNETLRKMYVKKKGSVFTEEKQSCHAKRKYTDFKASS